MIKRLRCLGQFGFLGSYCNVGCNKKYKCLQMKNNMETKEVKIEIPEGYEIDESKSSFEKIVFKKKGNELPKTWEEYLKSHRYKDFFLTIDVRIRLKLNYEKAFIALAQLIELRDYYNNGWVADWDDMSQPKYIISYYDCIKVLKTYYAPRQMLNFKTEKLCKEFYNNFKDLIEQAKELL